MQKAGHPSPPRVSFQERLQPIAHPGQSQLCCTQKGRYCSFSSRHSISWKETKQLLWVRTQTSDNGDVSLSKCLGSTWGWRLREPHDQPTGEPPIFHPEKWLHKCARKDEAKADPSIGKFPHAFVVVSQQRWAHWATPSTELSPWPVFTGIWKVDRFL